MPNNIQFNEDVKSMPGYGISNWDVRQDIPKGIIGWLMKYGIVRSEKTGMFILIVVVLINFVLSAIIFFSA